jgi:hypothetical protein
MRKVLMATTALVVGSLLVAGCDESRADNSERLKQMKCEDMTETLRHTKFKNGFEIFAVDQIHYTGRNTDMISCTGHMATNFGIKWIDWNLNFLAGDRFYIDIRFLESGVDYIPCEADNTCNPNAGGIYGQFDPYDEEIKMNRCRESRPDKESFIDKIKICFLEKKYK